MRITSVSVSVNSLNTYKL